MFFAKVNSQIGFTDFVVSHFSLSSSVNYWIGLNSYGITWNSDDIKWNDGTPVTYTQWALGKFNPRSVSLNYLVLNLCL